MTCRNCWEPTQSEEDLCSWCRLTPVEKRAKVNRNYRVLIVVVLLILTSIAAASFVAANGSTL